MFDHMMGLLLLGLGINKSMFTPGGSVQGDQTVATASATANAPPSGNQRPMPAFRLNPSNYAITNTDFRGGKSASGSGGRITFDTRAFGKAVMTMQADFAGRVESSREAAMQEFQNHKTAFQQQLIRIKDTRKQGIVDKINTDCQTVNQKRTIAMTAMLAKLSTILTNVSNRSASAAASGKDTSSLDTAVTTAQGAIADAQTAVAAQAGTTCTITIASDATVKNDVGIGIGKLQTALSVIYQKVMIARKSVGDAIHALAQVTGESLTAPKGGVKPATVSGGQK